MAAKQNVAREPQFEREALRELALCYARAAVDELIANARGSKEEAQIEKSETAARKKKRSSRE